MTEEQHYEAGVRIAPVEIATECDPDSSANEHSDADASRHSKRAFASSLRLCASGFLSYVFNRFLMYIPSCQVRLFFLRLRVAKLGKGVGLLMGLELRNGRNVFIGNRVVINRKVLLDGRGGRLVIGDDVDIAQETNIWTLEHDVHSDTHADKGGDVIIEDHAWIASRATILPGVRIGKGAVVASNSVVTKDVPPMAIVGGIPARVIGLRRSRLNYRLHFRPWFE
jgi:acetyltransferase-like isoleucine patch superfamily enzyme